MKLFNNLYSCFTLLIFTLSSIIKRSIVSIGCGRWINTNFSTGLLYKFHRGWWFGILNGVECWSDCKDWITPFTNYTESLSFYIIHFPEVVILLQLIKMLSTPNPFLKLVLAYNIISFHCQ